MFETVDALFKGICDAIREKDGTTALISHQQIPARIVAISSGGDGGRLPDYDGDYEVTPKTEDQLLNTENKSMTKDVVIKKIPTFEVSNESGTTFIIGG